VLVGSALLAGFARPEVAAVAFKVAYPLVADGGGVVRRCTVLHLAVSPIAILLLVAVLPRVPVAVATRTPGSDRP
jgi:hypothetical protein